MTPLIYSSRTEHPLKQEAAMLAHTGIRLTTRITAHMQD